MKKQFIRFSFRNKKQNITLPIEMAEVIIDSKEQLVKLYDKDGNWTGVTINKAEITGTDHDFEMEQMENRIVDPARLLAEKEPNEAEKEKIREITKKLADKFKVKKYWEK